MLHRTSKSPTQAVYTRWAPTSRIFVHWTCYTVRIWILAAWNVCGTQKFNWRSSSWAIYTEYATKQDLLNTSDQFTSTYRWYTSQSLVWMTRRGKSMPYPHEPLAIQRGSARRYEIVALVMFSMMKIRTRICQQSSPSDEHPQCVPNVCCVSIVVHMSSCRRFIKSLKSQHFKHYRPFRLACKYCYSYYIWHAVHLSHLQLHLFAMFGSGISTIAKKWGKEDLGNDTFDSSSLHQNSRSGRRLSGPKQSFLPESFVPSKH